MITKWTRQDIAYGRQLDQWLIGALGAMLTTLPAFVILPFWWGFCEKNKIQKEDGEIDTSTCFAITFFSGIAIWIVALIINCLFGK